MKCNRCGKRTPIPAGEYHECMHCGWDPLARKRFEDAVFSAYLERDASDEDLMAEAEAVRDAAQAFLDNG